jgi:uncharacterized surface protein with fasciclin (FAS1) repeats
MNAEAREHPASGEVKLSGRREESFMIRRIVKLACALAVALATTLVTVLATALPASAHTGTPPTGTRSLAELLAKDGSGFDKNWSDYDILDNAVGAVLAAKPNSPVAVLADGNVPLTAFLPTDRAFRRLAHSLTGKSYHSEKKVFTKLAGTLGVDTIESVLLYHVVPGATITYRQALKANGAVLQTALEGATVKVKVRCWVVILKDNDPNARNPIVVQPNLNKGNKQIGHGINRVLRPVDL